MVSKKEQFLDDKDCKKEHIVDQKTSSETTALRVRDGAVSETSTLIEYKQCSMCSQSVSKVNFDLHLLHCKSTDKKITKKSKNKLQTKEVFVTSNEDEDLDTLLASVIKSDNICHFTRCKTSIATLAQTCQFCSLRYCLSHHIPEVHGCGDLAKAHARSQIRKEGKLYHGSGTPSRKPDITKKAHLQRKLDKKLVELSKQRKGKK